jgi:hypothetical protein
MINKPVLFLDFDGPLFPDRVIRHGPTMALYPGRQIFHPFIDYWEMDETSVRQINSLYDIYQFDTVVSSSWKHYCEKEHVLELFEINGLKIHLHDDWRTPNKMSSYRVHDICWWLDDYTVKQGDKYIAPAHIILDDPLSGNSLEGDGWRCFALQEPFIVDPDVGIDSACYKNMVRTVECWRDDYVTRTYVRDFPGRNWSGIVED